MEDGFREFWWLIFPIGGLAMGAFGMWIGYQRQRDTLDLMKTYAAQGKDPAEVARLLGVSQTGTPPPWDGQAPGWSGPRAWGGYWGGPSAWGHYWSRFGPYRQWRRFISLTCVSIGFGIASRYAESHGTEHAFVLVAIITGVLAFGALMTAILSTMMATTSRPNEK